MPGTPLLPGSPYGPAEGGRKILKRKSSWHRRRQSKILAVSLKHWKGRKGGGGGRGRLLRCTAVRIHPCPVPCTATPPHGPVRPEHSAAPKPGTKRALTRSSTEIGDPVAMCPPAVAVLYCEGAVSSRSSSPDAPPKTHLDGPDVPLASAKAASTQASPGPSEPCTGCNRFLLSSGCEWGEYYRVAYSTGPAPNETRVPCRTLVACLGQTPQSPGGWPGGDPGPQISGTTCGNGIVGLSSQGVRKVIIRRRCLGVVARAESVRQTFNGECPFIVLVVC